MVFVRPVSGDVHIFLHRASDNTDVDLFGDAYTEGQPDVSPDGSRIAFTRGGGSATGCYYRCVYVMNSDGSGVTQVTSFPSSPFSESRYDNNPRWSPDRQWLVFVRWNQNTSPPQWDVYKVRPDGNGLTALTTHGEADMVATWSPDGTRVAYDRKEGGYYSTTVQIHVMDAADGGNDHRVTGSTSGYRDESPAWSPDGNRIYFASTETGNGDLTGLMYSSHSNGFADQTGVSRTTLTSPSLGQSDETPRLSADGNTVYFGSTRDVWEHIYKIVYSGGSWSSPTAVTSGNQNDAHPSPVNADWRPPPYQCGDLKFFGARGSGQASNDHGGYGKEIASTLTFVENLLPARTNLQAQAVDYPAIAVNWWQPSYYVADYQASEAAGVESLQFDVLQYIRNCPTKKIILAGYSQGADVVGDTFLGLNPDEATHIAAVIMFGDPKFNPAKSQNKVDQGDYKYWFGVETQPVLGRTTPPPRVIADTQQPRVHSYCTKGDPVCNFNEYNAFTCSGNTVLECAHLRYIERGWTYEGAKWVVNQWKKVK
jgi:Tol biopolymer transport system component